jgi:hypothetical protein
MKKLAAAFVLFPALLSGCGGGGGGGGKQSFQDYSSADGRFEVKFPAGNVQTKEQSPAGIKQTVIGIEQRDGAFQVFYQDLPFGQQATMDQAIDVMSKQMDGKVTHRGDFELQGNKGREFEVQIRKPQAGYISTRLIVVNNRLYQMQVIGTNYRRDHADVQTFWNSFKIK